MLKRGVFSIGMCICLIFTSTPHIFALDFAVFPLEELADNSDTIVVGTVLKRKTLSEENHIYQIVVQEVIKGNTEKEAEIPVKVFQWSDEGLLTVGDQYLLLLTLNKGIHEISGVHQGFILIENGTSDSRFYNPREVERFLSGENLDINTLPQASITGIQFSTNKPADLSIKFLLVIMFIFIFSGLLWRFQKTRNK